MARIPASCRSSLNVPRIQGNDGWQYAGCPPRRSGLAPFAPRHRRNYHIPALAASSSVRLIQRKLAAGGRDLTRDSRWIILRRSARIPPRSGLRPFPP